MSLNTSMIVNYEIKDSSIDYKLAEQLLAVNQTAESPNTPLDTKTTLINFKNAKFLSEH